MAALLSSCSLFKVRNCPTTDWEKIGKGDAYQGYAADAVDRFDKACKDAPPADFKSKYASGYKVGIKAYCTNLNLFEVGVQHGNPRLNSCPEAQRTDLHKYFSLGDDFYSLSAKQETLKQQLNDEFSKNGIGSPKTGALEAELRDVEDKIDDIEKVRSQIQ